MSDFQRALAKWDAMAKGYEEKIENQKKTINRLLEQNLFMEGTLAGLASGVPDDTDIKTFAQKTIDKLDEMRTA